MKQRGPQVKEDTAAARASHVNSGTAIPRDELAWPEAGARVLRLKKVHLKVDERSTVTPYGGLALAAALVRGFDIGRVIDQHLHLLKLHLPFSESDHVLAQAFSLYVGGTCIEDMANLQHDEGVRRMLGACRLPDPTTAGDFLRRFDRYKAPEALNQLRAAVDETQELVWSNLRRKLGRRRPKLAMATIDMDGTIKAVYGVQKEGADFSYNGKFSLHPLLISMAETGECLAVRNRPGNMRSSEGAAEALESVLPRVLVHFQKVLVRGDSDFDRKDIRDVVEQAGAYFAFVARETGSRPVMAESLPEEAWQPFLTRAARASQAHASEPDFVPRRRKRNRRRMCARQRGYKDILLTKQWVAEVPWTPRDGDTPYRLVLRRQLIEERAGERFLFARYRYCYVLTNLPSDVTAEEVIDATYQRCDQENIIEQMGSGLAAWRMPVAEFDGNCAWLEIARLAWNIAKWVAQLALPAETLRWEWKRFRQAFVYLAATVTKIARQTWITFNRAHRFAPMVLRAHLQLQT